MSAAARSVPSTDTTVLVVGAGPVGLTLANLLGVHGVRAVVIDGREELIDYPRGVGMDDETLRTFQAAGIVEDVLPHTVPDQWIVFVNGRRRELAKFASSTRELGWPKRSGFIQPLVDRVLLGGLAAHPGVEVRWGTRLLGFEADADGVLARLADAEGGEALLSCDYLVGADGGRSTVRKSAGISFDGVSSSTRWLVADVANDPIGTPNSFVGCDPRRPYVSSGLPHGMRRFEFMLFDGEEPGDETAHALQLIRDFIPRGDLELVRARVYTHHARLAGTFRRGRVLLAGDAAHLMPPWQGQGYNTGIRDAFNLAWKLALVAHGVAHPDLLDTYEQERLPHAAAMVRLSALTGRFLSPTSTRVAAVRDTTVRALGVIPPLRDYILQMRFRPRPRYTAATVVGPDDDRAIGSLLPQPRVAAVDGSACLLDDLLGPSWAVLRWGEDPRRSLGPSELATLRRLGARFVTVLPPTQRAPASAAHDAREHRTVVDSEAGLRAWFNANPYPMVFLRPDRVVAAGCQPMDAGNTVHELARRLRLFPAGSEGALDAADLIREDVKT